MRESQLIKKIKELRQIKPNREWVSLTKKEILEKGKEAQIVSVSWFFTPIRKPALIVVPLVLVAAVLGGLFVYLNFLPQSFQLPTVFQFPESPKPSELTASLAELQKGLEKVTIDLESLKKAKDPNKALVMAEVIKATAKKGEEIVEQIKSKNSSQSKQVLATLGTLGETYRILEEVANDTQSEIIGSLIEDLEKRTLTAEDEERLLKAKDYYNEGKMEEAIFWLTRIEAIK